MILCLSCFGVPVICAALLFGALPAAAKPAESPDNSFPTALERVSSTFKAQSDRALDSATDAAARVLRDGQAAMAEVEKDFNAKARKFRDALNERKATLDIIGEDATARLDALTQETIAAWLESLPGTWTDAMNAMHRSAMETLDAFRDWLKIHATPEEPTQIHV